MKKLIKLTSILMAVFMTVGFTACMSNSGSDNSNKLDIYLLYKGYGDSWLTPLIDDFVNEDWVKAKYPGITRSDISYTSNSEDSDPYNKLSSGVSINHYDLMFGVNLQELESTGQLADLTDLVYLAEVPGESGVRVIDKIPERVLNMVRNSKAKAREDGNETYNVVSYIDGIYGMLYNKTILIDQLGQELPLTTEQFKSVGDYIQENGYKNVINQNTATKERDVIKNRANDNYWRSSYDVWWAQYEGITAVYDYYEGYDRGNALTGSRTVLDQDGRLESLSVVEDIIEKYTGSDALTVIDYMRAQTAYLNGSGIFHFNGDYFASEMSAQMANSPYDIRFMKMPVISSIVQRLDFYTHGKTRFETLNAEEKNAYDEKLRLIIKDVDNDLLYDESVSKSQGISKHDFDIVAEARCIGGYAGATGQAAVIPSYSPAKELAADFLRFMYTDKSIRAFTKESRGLALPSNYDISADTEIMSVVDPISKTKIELLKGTEKYEFIRIPSAKSTTLGKAGLDSIHYDGRFEVMFRQTGANRKSAEDIIAADLQHWNQTTWEQLVRDSN